MTAYKVPPTASPSLDPQAGQALDGAKLLALVQAGAAWLEKNVPALNALNVFPVPDGDTGTNLHLTLKAALHQAQKSPEDGLGAIAAGLAHGALLGARGNSGVILSQYLGGVSRALKGLERCSAESLAHALAEAAEAAYRGVAHPVEGTILTVARAAAQGAEAARLGGSPADVLAGAVEAAREAVAQTPTLLEALRQAGVVDAGGQGLLVLLEGALGCLQGRDLAREREAPPAVFPKALGALAAPSGFCTEFLVTGRALAPGAVQAWLEGLGESVLVVRDRYALRAHIHTLQPQAVLGYAAALGRLSRVKVEALDAQHRDFLSSPSAAPEAGIAVVAVAAGEGLACLFAQLGAQAVVWGGDTMNPSVQELLQAVASVAAPRVVLLPNHPNVIPAAGRAAALADKEVAVVPTRSLPQGVAALLAFRPDEGLAPNLAVMERARAGVRTAEVAVATRRYSADGLKVEAGQAIGLLEGRPLAGGAAPEEVCGKLLSHLGLAPGGLLTVYWGRGVSPEEAQALARSLEAPLNERGCELELVRGGQPHYPYILSAE